MKSFTSTAMDDDSLDETVETKFGVLSILVMLLRSILVFCGTDNRSHEVFPDIPTFGLNNVTLTLF